MGMFRMPRPAERGVCTGAIASPLWRIAAPHGGASVEGFFLVARAPEECRRFGELLAGEELGLGAMADRRTWLRACGLHWLRFCLKGTASVRRMPCRLGRRTKTRSGLRAQDTP
jgi:hypothetical protein